MKRFYRKIFIKKLVPHKLKIIYHINITSFVVYKLVPINFSSLDAYLFANLLLLFVDAWTQSYAETRQLSWAGEIWRICRHLSRCVI